MSAGRARGEHGNVSLLVVIMLPALLFAAGLVLDGGRQLQARRDANGAAAAAARAAVQLSGREAYARRLDPGARHRAGGGRAGPAARDRVGVDQRPVGHRHRPRRRRLPHPPRWSDRLGVLDGDRQSRASCDGAAP